MKMKKSFLAAIVSMLATTSSRKCPVPTSVQSDEVKENFSMEPFMGTYYEIAYHDYT
jgi:hypothetical protein